MKLITALMAFLAVAALMTGSVSAEPDYSDNSTNSTLAGTHIEHSLQWTDASGLSGYIFGFCNGTWNGADCGGGSGSSSWCYQENANESTACGGLSTGVYACSGTWAAPVGACINAYDGNWGTSGWGLVTYAGILEINYTKPTDAQSTSLWKVKDETGTTNLSIPSDCWNHDATKVILKGYCADASSYTVWQCYNGTWKTLRSQSGASGELYEEAIWWNISSAGVGWVNDTWTSMTGTTNWSNVTKPINTTTGANIAWKVYANDTSDNWNTSATYSYLTTSAPAPAVSVVTIEPGVIFDPSNSNTNYTFHSQYNVTSICVNTTHIEINSAMLKAEPNTGTVNCTIYDYGTTGTHYRAFNLTNTSVTIADGWCYQETSNVSTACGGLSTGTYTGTTLGSDSWTLAFDGNWNTHAYNIELFVNYTKPSTAKSSSVWMIKDAYAVTNYSTNVSLTQCWDGYSDKVVLKGVTTGAGLSYYAKYYCHNSTSWIEVLATDVSALRNDIYEEAMWWDLDSMTVTVTQGGYVLDDSLLIWRNKVRDGVAQLANATGFINITQTLSTYNITSYIGTTEPVITAYKLFTYGVHHNMTQLRDIYANITFYDTTTPAETFYINTTWFKTNTTGTYTLDSCCDTSNQTALNNTATVITVPCWSNQTTVADNISAQMTVVDSAGNTNTTNATGTIVSHWWDDYWAWEENW